MRFQCRICEKAFSVPAFLIETKRESAERYMKKYEGMNVIGPFPQLAIPACPFCGEPLEAET